MTARDPHRFVNELDQAALARLISRLESRAQDSIFARLFDKYVAQLALPPSAQVLEVGCGTGTNLRNLARRGSFMGKGYGVDQCRAFIDAAITFSRAENVADLLAFQVGDAHGLDFPSASFDAVIAHTLISHVTDPVLTLSEMTRVVRPGGTVVIFDGDYASMTYACSDHEFGQRMDTALVTASFNNPRIMRDLPRLLPKLGLNLTAAWGDVVVEIGKGSYFKSFAETYAPYVTKAGLLPTEAIEAWLSAQRQAMGDGTFFASCNYYTYMACRPDPHDPKPKP